MSMFSSCLVYLQGTLTPSGLCPCWAHTKRMQATARGLSVVSATSCARRRLIRNVRPTSARYPSPSMKKWSLVVAVLYGVALLVLMIPLCFGAFAPKTPKFSEITEALIQWQTWAIIFVMILAQLALLRIPVASSTGRPVAQRSVWSTVIAASFMMGLLVLGAVVSLHELFTRLEGSSGFILALSCGLASWVFWAIYFRRSITSAQCMPTLQKHLWRGSILELLIAVPAHIVARHRDYCCAGVMTFMGISCGMAVMLFAFGPAIYILFAERWKRLHPQPT
jgi:hypothetical protein